MAQEVELLIDGEKFDKVHSVSYELIPHTIRQTASRVRSRPV